MMSLLQGQIRRTHNQFPGWITIVSRWMRRPLFCATGMWLLTLLAVHHTCADDHWHILQTDSGLAQTLFEPVIILEPGAQYDLSDNEALAVGTGLMFEQSTGMNVTLVQPVAGQTLTDIVQNVVDKGFSPLVLVGYGWQTLGPAVVRQYPNQKWISIGSQWHVDQTNQQSSLQQSSLQQWQRSTDIAVLLYRQSIAAMTATESDQWVLRLHPKLQDQSELKARILCYQQAIQASVQHPLVLQWQTPQVSESMLATTKASLPGVADAQLLRLNDSALTQPTTAQTSIEWTLFLRTDFIAYQALLMSYEGRWQPNSMPIRATQGGWLFLGPQGEVLSPRYTEADQALCPE